MRRTGFWIALVSMICLLLSLVPGGAVADMNRPNLSRTGLRQVTVMIDGKVLAADAYIVDSRTMVPLRAIFEALGAVIEWDAETWTVTATKGAKVIKLTVGDIGAFVDGEAVQLAVPPVLIESRTFVPLRFVSQALGAQVDWDQANFKAIITTGAAGCTLNPFQKHSGTIQPGGETWGACGSPHIVSGTYHVRGTDSPVLTITQGATIQFESGAMLSIGYQQPGGLVVQGTAEQPVVLTAATPAPKAGFWNGIAFYDQAVQQASRLAFTKIEYAGKLNTAAITVDGEKNAIEVQLNNVEISNSAWAGLNLFRQGRLHPDSADLKIHDTVQASGAGGFPITSTVKATHNLPRGEYKNNFTNGVEVKGSTVSADTTWRNIGIPYAVGLDLYISGDTTPTLTIEPGTIVLFAPNKRLYVGHDKPGSLVADATAPFEGGQYTIGKAELDLGLQLASAKSLAPTCDMCGQNKAIVFAPWSATPDRGTWRGIFLEHQAVSPKLVGVVIAHAGIDGGAGLHAESTRGATLQLTLANSMISGSAGPALYLKGQIQTTSDSTGNYFVDSAMPMRLSPDTIGDIPAGQTFAGNTKQIISVTNDNLTKTATWKNFGLPYALDLGMKISSPSSPVLTIEPGSELRFGTGRTLDVGGAESGSLVAVGTKEKPIKFTADNGRKDGWYGIRFTSKAGSGNQIEYAIVEFATKGVELTGDFGPMIKNCTFNNNTTAIYRSVGTTDYTAGLGNVFSGNTTDQNKR